MATKMQPGDFNPLDVLATAASLQPQVSSESEGEGSSVGGGQKSQSSESTEGDDPASKNNTKTVCLNGDTGGTSVVRSGRATNVYKIHVKRLSGGEETSTNNNTMGHSINPASSCIVKVVTKKANGERVVETLRSSSLPVEGSTSMDSSKRKVTVLQIAKQGVDHSYCSAGPLARGRSEDDEGYTSRSSIDSPGQWRSDSESDPADRLSSKLGSVTSPISIRSPGQVPPCMDVASPQSVDSEASETVKSPSILAPHVFSPPLSGSASFVQQGAAVAKKAAKIVIMSRDSDVQKWISSSEPQLVAVQGSVASPSTAVTSQATGQNVVLRSLLGQAKRAPPTVPQTQAQTTLKLQTRTGAACPSTASAHFRQQTDCESHMRKTVMSSVFSPEGTPTEPGELSPGNTCAVVASVEQNVEVQAVETEQNDSCNGCTMQRLSDDAQAGRSPEMASSGTMLHAGSDGAATGGQSLLLRPLDPNPNDHDVVAEPTSQTLALPHQVSSGDPAKDVGSSTEQVQLFSNDDVNKNDGASDTGDVAAAEAEAAKPPQTDSETIPQNKTLLQTSPAAEQSGQNADSVVSARVSPRLPAASTAVPVQLGMKYMIAGTDAQDKMVLLPLSRNKYVIEDDIPPIGAISQQQQRTLGSAGVTVVSPTAGKKDSWEVLGTVDQKGFLSRSGAGKNPTVAIPTSMVTVPPLQTSQSQTVGLLSGDQVVSLQRGVPGPISIVQQYGSSPAKSKQSSFSAPLKVTAVGSATQSKAAFIPGSSKVLARSPGGAITLVEKKVLPGLAVNGSSLVTVPRSVVPLSSVMSSTCTENIITVCSTTAGAPCTTTLSTASLASTDSAESSVLVETPLLPMDSASQDSTDDPQLVTSEESVDTEGIEQESQDVEMEMYEQASSVDTSSTSSNRDLTSPSSAVLSSGRMTPLELLDNSPGDKINIKISGSKVIDVTGLGDSNAGSLTATTSIGTVGSLSSWTSLGSLTTQGSPTEDTSLEGAASLPPPKTASTPLFVLQAGAAQRPSGRKSAQTPPRSHSDSALSALVSKLAQRTQLQRQTKLDSSSDGLDRVEMSARTCHSYVKKRSRMSSLPAQSILDLTRMKQCAQLISRLHPIIDHDYCMFAEFSAEIQSSIIATTETKLKNERKYAKKAKAARTKAVRGTAPTDKTGRVKRKYVRRKLLTARRSSASTATAMALNEATVTAKIAAPGADISREVEAEIGADAMEQLREKRKYVRGGEKKAKIRSARLREKSDKNYVKITGSYQDEFVYFTTKKTRGRPRKSIELEDIDQVPAKLQAVGGLSVFDWYRDLSKSDKGSRFGVSGMGNSSSGPSNPAPGVTPLHDSDVVDLVMDMLPHEGLDEEAASEDKMFGLMSSNRQVDKVEEEVVISSSDGPGNDSALSPADFADQVRCMLSSMGADAGLKLLEDLGETDTESAGTDVQAAEKEDTEEGTPVTRALKEEVPSRHDAETSLNSLNALLTPYSQESSSVPQLQTTPNHQLLDLDDINDSDLIQSELPGMNMIFSDLKSTSATSTTWTDAKVSQSGFSDPSASPMKNYLDSDLELGKVSSGTSASVENTGMGFNFGKPLDKAELFPDMTSLDMSPSVSSVPQDSGVPELTVVSMYWNDLPGLIINGRQYVRLVDIHKQVLPAKDTGILKKRCQMMGLDIINCTELQRDFLIRYANAAKSKSTVVAPKEAAQTLIGFYVDPRPRVTKQTSHGESKEEALAKANDAGLTGESSSSSSVEETKQKSDSAEGADKKQEVKQEEEEEHSGTGDASDPETESDTAAQSSKTKTSAGTSKAKSSPPTPRKRRVTGEVKGDPASTPHGAPRLSPDSMQDVKRSDRLKNRRVQYAAMAQGNFDGIEDSPAKGGRASAQDHADDSNSENNEDSATELLPAPFPEESEIRKLRTRQKKRALNKKEKKKLKRLRERLRMKLSNRKRLAKKLAKSPKQERSLKAKQRLKEKHLNGSKYEQEHCYAAHPAPAAAKQQPQQQNNNNTDMVEETVVPMETELEVKTESSSSAVKLEVPESSRVLGVLHRNGHRSRGQEGCLNLHRFKTKEAACIECTTCQEVFSVRRFLKHMHKQNNPDELMEVALLHKLEIQNRTPTDEESTTWVEFQQRRTGFEQRAIANRRASRLLKQASSDRTSAGDTEDDKAEDKSASDTSSELVCKTEKESAELTDPPDCQPERKPSVSGRARSSLDSVEDFQKLSSDASSPVKIESPKLSTFPSDSSSTRKTSPSMRPRRISSPKADPVEASGTRHSTRVRKRKQFHPMESYVFSGAAGESVAPKRTRHESGLMRHDAKQRDRS